MSIIPVGNRKEQVSQGALKNENILDSDLFKKFAQGASGLVDTKRPTQEPEQGPNEIQDAMSGGGLDHNQMANTLEQQGVPGMDLSNPQGITPAGGGSPASQFLGQDPEAMEGQVDPNQLWQMERQKIRTFIGNDFGMRLQQSDDGTFTVSLKPPGTQPVQDPTGFMDSLLQHIGGGTVNEEDTPAVSDLGGSLTLKYRPNGAGPQKIRPQGKGRR